MPAIVVPAGAELPQEFERSVFLAAGAGAWADEAIAQLQGGGFEDGVIFVGDEAPEGEAWRNEAMKVSDAIVSWVAPGAAQTDCVTSTVLHWGPSGKLFVGHEEGSWAAPLTANFGQLSVATDLAGVLAAAWKMVKAGAARKGPEREVPLMIWRTPPWKLWYDSQLQAGNRLDGAKIEWTFRVGPGGAFVLFWAIHADIHVTSEKRNKSNEVVIARPDVCCTLAYVPGPHMLDTEIIVIKEYRSPCRNQSGFVYELPGGSSFKPNTDVYQTAADELFEESGLAAGRRPEHEENAKVVSVRLHRRHELRKRLEPLAHDG